MPVPCDTTPNKVSALLTHHQTRHAPCLCTVIDTPPRHGQDRRRRRTAPGDDISTTVSSSLCEPRDVHVGCRTCWCAISLHQRPPRHGMTSPPLVDCHRGLHVGRWPPRRGLGPAHHCQEHDHTRDHLLSAARTDWRGGAPAAGDDGRRGPPPRWRARAARHLVGRPHPGAPGGGTGWRCGSMPRRNMARGIWPAWAGCSVVRWSSASPSSCSTRSSASFREVAPSRCAEARGSAAARGDNAPMLRVVGPRSQRYNAVSPGVAGAGDVTVPRIATRERRHEHALRR